MYTNDQPYHALPGLGAEYALGMNILVLQSLRSTPAPTLRSFYQLMLRYTRLKSASSSTSTTLRTVALGRIFRNEEPTYWVVVMEIQNGLLFALKSDYVSVQEVIKDDPDKEHYSDAVDGVGIPELDDTPWKAALLGDTTLLDVDVERAATDHRCTMLDVVDWDSIEVHQ